MELLVKAVVVFGEVEKCRDDSAGDGQKRVKVPRTFPEPFPGKTNNAYNDISYVNHREGQEYVV